MGKHAGLEEPARVGQLHPHRHGAGFSLQRRVNIGHSARESFVGIGIDAHGSCGAIFDLGDVLLEDIGNHPHRRQVSNLVQRLTRHETHALHRFFLHHDAGDRRAKREGALNIARRHQRLHLVFGNVPVLQTLQAAIGQLFHARQGRATGIFQRIQALHGNRVFALRRHQFRAVHLKQRLPLADGLPGGVDMQALHVTLELG